MKIFFIGGGVLLIAILQSSPALLEAPSNGEGYFIIAGEDTILSGCHIENYNRTTSRMVLTPEGYRLWTGYENRPIPKGKSFPDSTMFTGRLFKIVSEGVPIAEGSFHFGTASKLQAGLVLWDSHEKHRGRLYFKYMRFEPDMPANPCESDEFIEYFNKSGKLIDWSVGR